MSHPSFRPPATVKARNPAPPPALFPNTSHRKIKEATANPSLAEPLLETPLENTNRAQGEGHKTCMHTRALCHKRKHNSLRPSPFPRHARKRSIINPKLSSIHTQVSTCKGPISASQVVLSRMQLTLNAAHPTLHRGSCLVHAMFASSVKTRRAPSRHFTDTRVCSHMTTAMQ